MALTLKNLVTIFAAPTEVFEELKQKPRWAVAFLTISFFTIVIALLSLPLSRQIMLQAVSRGGAVEGAQLEQAQRFQYVGSILIPLTLLFKWLVSAALLYFMTILAGSGQIRFKEVYAAVVFAEMILLLMAVVNLLLLVAKGADSIRHITDLQGIIGMDFLMPDRTSNLPLFTLLNNINIFNIWYIAVLSIGISVMSGFSRVKSALLVTTMWLLGVGLQVAIAALTAAMQRPQL